MTVWAGGDGWAAGAATIALVLLGAAMYARAVRFLGARRRRFPWRLAASFWAGAAAVVVAVASPLESASHEALWAHMVQHLLLVGVAPPLLLLGRPLLVARLAAPSSVRAPLRRVGRAPTVRWTVGALTHPAVAWPVHVVSVWAWHAPGPYQAAVENDVVHLVEHVVFLVTGLLFWSVVTSSGRRALPPGARVIYMLTAWLQGGALGALLTFAPGPLYPVYEAAAAEQGRGALEDQQLAGLVMWIPGGLVYLGAASALFVRMLLRIERATAAAEGSDRPEVVAA